MIEKAIEHCENASNDSHESSDEEPEEVKTVIKEVVYLTGEKVYFQDDVYSLTIAASMFRECSPTEYIFCLRQCVYVFIFQMSIAYYFGYKELDLTFFNTDSFNILNTLMRAICALLLQLKLNKELKNGFRLMFIKVDN